MQISLVLNDAEYAVLHPLIVQERDEVHHLIHKAAWKSHDELKERLATIEGILKKMEQGKK